MITPSEMLKIATNNPDFTQARTILSNYDTEFTIYSCSNEMVDKVIELNNSNTAEEFEKLIELIKESNAKEQDHAKAVHVHGQHKLLHFSGNIHIRKNAADGIADKANENSRRNALDAAADHFCQTVGRYQFSVIADDHRIKRNDTGDEQQHTAGKIFGPRLTQTSSKKVVLKQIVQ